MSEQLLSRLLVSATLLVLPAGLFGKAETVLVTITRGTLASPVRITDAEVLRASQAWGSEFLDASRAPLTQAPKVEGAYEVSFYSKLTDGDIRKTCVFFYSPGRTDAAQGTIYLPSKGAVWRLNSGTIIRTGRDGKWSYASPAWEALIKPFLSRAVAGLSTSAAPEWEIAVERWTKPLPGWLYVLDPRSERGSAGSRVWLVDPDRSVTAGSVRAGRDADFALSPDGSRLYIVSGERESGELAVMDTATGDIRHIRFLNRELYNPHYQRLPPFSAMALTGDSRALWISGQGLYSPERIETRLSVFDTRSESFQKESVNLGNCDTGDFVAELRPRAHSASCAGPLRMPTKSDSCGLTRPGWCRVALWTSRYRRDALQPRLSRYQGAQKWPWCAPTELCTRLMKAGRR